MSWRVVVVSQRCKLESRLGYLVCRGEQTKKVHLSEIDCIVVESTGVSLTAALLCELVKNKVNIVFCDEKHNPVSQLLALRNRHNASGCLRRQIAWKEKHKAEVWAEIVRYKIFLQQSLLQQNGLEQYLLLQEYAAQIKPNDLSNREGHAAKVYFNALFGLSFRRGDDTFVNSALNYGYSVVLSAFNREIVANGYNTQLGIAHKNEYNFFNLSCDLMEPFRVLVDRFVFFNDQPLSTDYKHRLCNLLNERVKIQGERNTVSAAISIYCKSVFEALDSGDVSKIKCYEL